MTAWKRVKLGEVAKMMRGKAVTRSSIVPGNVPVMLGGREPAYYCNESNHTGPCFIVSRSGASAGYVSYWDEPIFVTDGFLFESDSKDDTQFLYYSLKARQQSLIMSQNGTGIPHVRGEDLKNIELVFPTEVDRKRIAAILSDYDAAIANCRKQIALLEEAAMRLYREWFGDGKGEKGRIGDFVRIKRGKVITKANAGVGSVPVIAAGIAPAYFNDKANVLGPSVTISASGANAGYVWFHPEDIWASDCSYVSRSESPYVYFCYTMLLSKQKEISKQQKGSAQPHVHASDVEGLAFEIPEVDKVEKFERCVTPQFEMIGDLSRQIRSLTEARDRLLPKLMKGEIAV